MADPSRCDESTVMLVGLRLERRLKPAPTDHDHNVI